MLAVLLTVYNVHILLHNTSTLYLYILNIVIVIILKLCLSNMYALSVVVLNYFW